MTDFSAETVFVKTYIRKNRQERILYELTTPGKRCDGLSRFCHQAGELINPARIGMEGEDLDHRAEFTAFVRKNNEICRMLSPDPSLDQKRLLLEEAVSEAAMGTDAALIIGNGFALVFTEAEKGGRNKYLLYAAISGGGRK